MSDRMYASDVRDLLDGYVSDGRDYWIAVHLTGARLYQWRALPWHFSADDELARIVIDLEHGEACELWHYVAPWSNRRDDMPEPGARVIVWIVRYGIDAPGRMAMATYGDPASVAWDVDGGMGDNEDVSDWMNLPEKPR